jgi:flagellar basal-body rod protein FlgF
MQNSLLVGLSRQMSLSHQIDILANNIANIDTTGFKADTAVFSEYLMPGASDGDFSGKDNRISFVQDTGTWIDFSPGTMQRTGDPLDVAINGKGFFQVQTSRGPRYTRNGAFAINAQGQLVTSGGDLVLGTTGPMNFAPTDRNVIISGSGMISTRDGNSTTSIQRGQLQLVDFDNPQQMQKDGASLFQAPPEANQKPIAPGTSVVQGSIEKSNVEPILEMTRMIAITRSYSDVASILQQQGELRRNSLNQLAQATGTSG